MKRDPYSLIRAILARRVGGVIIRPLPPILRAHQIVLAKQPRRVRLISTQVNHS